MNNGFLLDLILIVYLLGSVARGATQGAGKLLSGLVSNIAGLVGAWMLTPRFTALTGRLLTPAAARVIEKAARETGLSDILSSPLVEGIRGEFATLMQKLGLSPAEVPGAFARGAGRGVMDAAQASLVELLAPGITFVVLLIIIKIAIRLVFAVLNLDLPVLRTFNKGTGLLLGAASGLLVVVLACLCWEAFAPVGSGFFSRQTLELSRLGSLVVRLL